MKRLVVAITGASGVVYGIRLLEALQAGRGSPDAVESHLVLSAAGRVTIAQETGWKVSAVEALAGAVYDPRDIGAAIASGSFFTMGMVVIPCSIKTLSHIATSDSGDLVARAADVTVKEGRPLVLVVRETPLHLGHLRLMVQAAEQGAVIMPPMPAFYGRPQTLDDLINGTVGRVLLRLGIDNELYTRWLGLKSRPAPDAG
jgi:4-hydroxy-3-polyprenylbenzoate decarboxylase